jgi:uncharacterized protein
MDDAAISMMSRMSAGPARRRVEVRLRPKQDEVGLRLRMQVQSHRALGLHDRIVACQSHQCAVGVIHARVVTRSDGRHRNDLAVDEFDAILRTENADLSHALILVGGETLPDDSVCHEWISILDWQPLEKQSAGVFDGRSRTAALAMPARHADKIGVPFYLPASAQTRVLVAVGVLVVLLQVPLGAAFPRPSGYVNDFASVLTEDDRAYLENFLRTLERDTTAEVAVATVSTLDGLTIEEYASRLFGEWGIGKRTRDNGILLLVAPAERRVRIEVGYGLEGVLPDGLAGEIIRADIVPEFQQGNLRRGIGRGLDRISRVVRGDVAAMPVAPPARTDTWVPPAVVVALFFGTFVALAGFATGLGLRTRTIVPLIAGSLLTVIPLLIAATMSPVSLAALVPLEMLALALGYTKGKSDYWTRTLRTGAPFARRDDDQSGWIMGGSSDGSSSSSSDAGGSSSSSDFGGGSSGGGGASGHW